MKEKKIKVPFNLSDYFLNLLNDLNHYEGSAFHFGTINIDFINYLKVSFVYLDDEAKIDILAKFKKEPNYKNHPFLPILLEILEGKNLKKRKEEQLLSSLKQYKRYPLTSFINLILNNPLDQETSSKVFIRELKKGNLLLFIYLINHQFKGISIKVKDDFINFFSAAGLSCATLLLAHEAVIHTDIEGVKQKLVLTARQAGKNILDFVGEKAFAFAKDCPSDVPMTGELFKLAADLDYENAFMPLITYYENALDLGEDRFAYAFYYLAIASFKYIEEAQRKLLTYYEKGIYIPKSRRLAQDLKDILND